MSVNKPSIIAKEEGSILVIHIGGDIIASTLPEARAMVDEIIEAYNIFRRKGLSILLDYKHVTDVDSATIANILERLSEHKKHQHIIAFVNVPDEFLKLVEINKLEDEIPIYASEKEALKELKRPRQ